MTKSIEKILRDSAELSRLNARIHTTFKDRDQGPSQREDWSSACREFHARFDQLAFPGGWARLSQVRQNNYAAVRAATTFLEADPYHFRSGYIKEELWRWLSRLELTSSDKSRMERAALSVLRRRVTRDFWGMCKAMPRVAGSEFWLKVGQLARSQDSSTAQRVMFLLLHAANIHSGTSIRKAIYRENLQWK